MLNNQLNLNSLDIQQARIKFILFKSKVRSILYGGQLDESLLSSRTNALGEWLYSSALVKYNYIPEMHEIEKINVDITGVALDLVRLYKSGKIEEARQGLESLNNYEEKLTRILGVIESKVAA